MNDFTNILQARAGGAVQRCHTIRHHGSYSVAEHSWGVAMLLLALYPEDFKRLVAFALVHDVPESLTGDVPSPVKTKADGSMDDNINSHFGLPQLGQLNERELSIIHTCDKLDLLFWAREQGLLGNCYAHEVTRNLDPLFNNMSPAESGLDPKGILFYQEHMVGGDFLPDRVGLLNQIKEKYAF